MHHILTSKDLTSKLITAVLKRTRDFETNGYRKCLAERIIAHLFFEASTRTRLSFEAAVLRCGGRTITVTDSASSSFSKGETLEDMIRVVSRYADAIVIRHPEEGSAQRAAAVSVVPVINAGDGANAHPTQTLVDLYAIHSILGRLDNFTITMVGDLKYSRVAHSLAEVLCRYDNVQQIWIAPTELAMPETIRKQTKQRGIDVVEDNDYRPMLAKTDILLMTRIQRERFSDTKLYERIKNHFVLTEEDLHSAKPTLKVIAPLPRTEEIPTNIDVLPQAYYFQQAAYGVVVRAALLDYLFNG